MNDRSDELLFTWLNQRVERVTGYGARHPLTTDALLALLCAALGVAGLAHQDRLQASYLAFTALLSAPLLVRHRSVELCFALVAAVALVQFLVSWPQLSDAAVLIALYWVCLRSGPRVLLAALLAVEAGATMVAFGWEPAQTLRYWVGMTALAVAASALGIMIRQRRALLASLEERAARLERERDQQGQLGAATERARIAREMHDIVSHNLTVMIALADGASYALADSPERATDAIERVSATGRQALVEMRRLLGVLRDDSIAQPLEPQPGLERLDDLLARVEAAGVPVSIAISGDPHDLTPGVQLTVFRVAQEALTNTLKHAARPTSAHLALRCGGGEVELDVTNTGSPGALVSAGGSVGDGSGVRGMRERATAYGGELEAGPTADGGWRVHMLLHAETAGSMR
jgi:signal transduction histidine kinase